MPIGIFCPALLLLVASCTVLQAAAAYDIQPFAYVDLFNMTCSLRVNMTRDYVAKCPACQEDGDPCYNSAPCNLFEGGLPQNSTTYTTFLPRDLVTNVLLPKGNDTWAIRPQGFYDCSCPTHTPNLYSRSASTTDDPRVIYRHYWKTYAVSCLTDAQMAHKKALQEADEKKRQEEKALQDLAEKADKERAKVLWITFGTIFGLAAVASCYYKAVSNGDETYSHPGHEMQEASPTALARKGSVSSEKTLV